MQYGIWKFYERGESMSTVFIGWSGNKSLADKLAALINRSTAHKAVVGGGLPKDMYVGAQVIGQINKCNSAILLVEDKKEDGQVSANLMFEWGYIMAKMSPNNICTVLINKSHRDLPSDLLGTWVSEIPFDRESGDEDAFAETLYQRYLRDMDDESKICYFDDVNDWKKTFIKLKEDIDLPEDDLCRQILMGCLAAYYYQDNRQLRKWLDGVSGTTAVNEVVSFAKSYVDVFLESENMTKALSQTAFFECVQVFETILARKAKLPEKISLLLDILCLDVYGLACVLYLKNTDIDEETRSYCANQAKDRLVKMIEMLSALPENYETNPCLVQLLKSYANNDLAHLYKNAFGDMDNFLAYLAESVEQRKNLHRSFLNAYTGNTLLATKFEQEYFVALSEQCNYMEDSFYKTMCKNSIKAKYAEWQRELIYTSSLTDRIKKNIENF